MNHLQTPEYKELRDIILKSEGKTIEDEERLFGCKYLHYWDSFRGNEEDELTLIFQDGGSKNFLCKREGVQIIQHFDVDDFIAEDFLILGHPISLDRVLLCMISTVDNKYHPHNPEERNKKYEYLTLKILGAWTLGQPLHLQPLETIKKLLEILNS